MTRGRPILTAHKMRDAEQASIDGGTSVETLMERAGAALAEAVLSFAGPMPALILCGPGNNGGDGYVAARLLAVRGVKVRVSALAEPATDAAQWARGLWTGEVETLSDATPPAPLLIDALFGTGLKRGLDEAANTTFLRLCHAAVLRVPCDLPRGAADRPHRIEVSVKNRKGLTVRNRSSFVEKSVETRTAEAVVASLSFFLLARHALVAGGYSGVIGALPMAQAVALAVLLANLIRMERRSPQVESRYAAPQRDPGRLAMVAGAVLACVTAAIPLQLDREWITLGWALLAAALAALYLRIPHRGLLWWTAGLLGAVFVRLALNPAVLGYHPRSDTAIWNWYLYTYLVPALAFFLAAWLLSRGEDRLADAPVPRLSTLAASGAVVLLFLLVNIEIADFFSKGASLAFGFLTGQATLAEDLTYTLAWALFAIALFVAGIVRPVRAVRVTGIILLLVAVLKAFVHDMAQLGGLYRVGSFAGLGICLALMAVLIQKYVLPRREAQ